MGILMLDELSEFEGFESPNPRRELLVLMGLYREYAIPLYRQQNENEIRSVLSELIKRNLKISKEYIEDLMGEPKQNIEDAMRMYLEEPETDNQLINWIKDDHRLMQWILNNLPKEASRLLHPNDTKEAEHHFQNCLKTVNTRAFNNIIAFLDSIPLSITTSSTLKTPQIGIGMPMPMPPNKPIKILLIETLHSRWKDFKQQTRFYSLFFQDDTELKLSLINNYKGNQMVLRGAFDNIDDACIALDKLVCDNHHSEVELYIKNLRNRYNKATYDARNKYARQVNSMLPNDLIEKLDKTAASKGIKRNELIVRLLREGLKSKT